MVQLPSSQASASVAPAATGVEECASAQICSNALKKVAEGFPAQILDASACSAGELGALTKMLFGLRKSLDEAAAA